MNGIEIVSTGYAKIEKTLDNQQLEQMVETSNEWIVSRTGILKRHLSDKSSAFLAIEAAKKATQNQDLSQLALIIVATMTPENNTPSNACLVQKALGLNHHDQETGYRYYTTWDLHMLIRARCYLGFGLSIEETAGILQSKSLEEIDDLLEEQEQIIQKNIIYQMNLLKRLRTNRKLISRSENLNFTLQKRPGIYRIDTQKCYTIDLKKEEREELKEFCQKIPFVFSTALFPKEHIENENKEFYYGIGVEEEFAGVLDIKESEYVHYYPEQLCLYMCVPSRSSQILTYEVLQPAFDYMEKNNLQLAGDVISQVVSMWKPEDEYFNYHTIWIPVQ